MEKNKQIKGFDKGETNELIQKISNNVMDGVVKGRWYPNILDPYKIYMLALKNKTMTYEQFELKLKVTTNKELLVKWKVLNDLWKRSFLYDQNYRGIFAQIAEFELKLFDKHKTVEVEPLISIHTSDANDIKVKQAQLERENKELKRQLNEKNTG